MRLDSQSFVQGVRFFDPDRLEEKNKDSLSAGGR